MKYRIILKELWWTPVFNASPQYLFKRKENDFYEIGCRTTARKYKWEFTIKEVDELAKRPGFGDLFFVEGRK